MRKALVALDNLDGGPGPWTFGGGTALAWTLDHRVGYGVGIFLDSSTALKNLAPNTNPVTKSLCDTWQWPGERLKLVLRGVGEIDFTTAPSYTDDPTRELAFDGRTVATERPSEIAAKTLVYRASTCTASDAFDLAAVYLHDRPALDGIARCPAITPRVVSAALSRLNRARRAVQSGMRDAVNPTARGEEFIDEACEIALEALAEIRNLIPRDEPRAGNGMSPS